MSTIERDLHRAMDELDLQDSLLEAERIKNAEAAIDESVLKDLDAVVLQLQDSVKARISNAILDVIDEGNAVDFAFWHPFEPVADQARILFRDRVLERLKRG